jgi:hypothetical protein
MSTSRTFRLARVRRATAITAAAVAVVVGPSACESGPDGSAPSGGDGYGYGYGAAPGPTPEVVRVGNAEELEAPEDPADGTAPEEEPDDQEETGETGQPAEAARQPPVTTGLDVLGNDCGPSDLPPHDGFQQGDRCVGTAFGEVAAADRSPSLLITDAPQKVKPGQEFAITVSTRNLVRDRFLGAAVGGYYLESSFLTDGGIQRGHFHTACRMLPSLDEAPDAAPAPAFFEATQDSRGGATPDSVTITVKGLDTRGTAQCAVWAGDGSHRVPMMERANQTPAFDAVRITVR